MIYEVTLRLKGKYVCQIDAEGDTNEERTTAAWKLAVEKFENADFGELADIEIDSISRIEPADDAV